MRLPAVDLDPGRDCLARRGVAGKNFVPTLPQFHCSFTGGAAEFERAGLPFNWTGPIGPHSEPLIVRQ